MAEDQDKSQKTEDPTPKKLEDAIKRGQVAFSREVTTFIMLVMLSIKALVVFSPSAIVNGHDNPRYMGIPRPICCPV